MDYHEFFLIICSEVLNKICVVYDRLRANLHILNRESWICKEMHVGNFCVFNIVGKQINATITCSTISIMEFDNDLRVVQFLLRSIKCKN